MIGLVSRVLEISFKRETLSIVSHYEQRRSNFIN